MNSYTTKVFLVFVVLLVALNRSSAQDSSRPPDKETVGKAALVGFSANLQAFPFYQCRYSTTKAQARSVKDALRGEFINAICCEHRVVVDDNKDLYEGLAPPARLDLRQARPIPGKPGLSSLPATTAANRYLGNGQQEMNFVPELEAVNLFSNEKSTLGIARAPFGMGFFGHRGRNGPGELAQSGLYEISSDGFEEVEGRLLISVRFKNKQYGYVRRYSFDPEKGYLPVRYEIWDGGRLITQGAVTHVLECSNQRYFPERSVVVDIPDKAGSLYHVSEIKVLELDADNRPATSVFKVTVPAGTQVCDHDDARRFFKLRQEEKIHIDDLPKLFAMLDQKQVTPLMDTAIPRPNPYRWFYWSGIGVGLTLALGSLYGIWRKLRPQAG